ncbi:cytochrome P450 93A2-like [Tripterygium wilfordii]|uniref:cytochrome P450 93A2-like n=1 Tax=Tripterygium wilfordii TaxID=458696 RepID=UPI0018F814C9|nr:cytochrome P450 93A2-like [Tripterygium wilfordii]
MDPLVDVSCYCFLFFISVIVSFVVIGPIIKLINDSNKLRLPPSPPALPIIGHTHLLSSRLPEALKTLAYRYGPIMRIQMVNTTYVVVSAAITAEEILKTHDIVFSSKFCPGTTQHNIYGGLSFINSTYGKYWRFVKKLCMTKLFAGSQLKQFIHIREQETLKLLKSLEKKSKDGEPCDLSVELETLTQNIICRMAIGRRCLENPDQAMEIRRLVKDIVERAAKFYFIEVYGPLKKFDIFGNGMKLRLATWRYDELAEKIMKEYEKEEDDKMKSSRTEEKDVMDILLETYKDPDAEVKLTRGHIKCFFMDMFLAAVDTTTSATQWTVAELFNHPQVFKRLRDEIDSVVGSKRLVEESDIPSLPYLQAVIKETLRLHPPGPLLRRQCFEDMKVNGYDIKAGTKIFINVYAIMRDPSMWIEPDKFVPERFLDNSTKVMDLKGHNYSFLPFGSGRRACLGSSHASFVMHVTVGALVQCLDWKFEGGGKVDIETVKIYSGAIAHSLICYPTARLSLSDV